MAQRSKSFGAPSRKRFRAPQEGLRSNEPPKRRRWRVQRGGDGAAVEIVRRSKPKTISGTARGVAKQRAAEAPPVAGAARRGWRSGRNCAPLQGAGNFGHRKRATKANPFTDNFISHRGVAQLVARLLWEQDAGCSSHLTPTIKETSFVYHGKRRSFCVFSNKTRKTKQIRASERSIDFSGALFFVFRARKRSKMLVYFLRFLAL